MKATVSNVLNDALNVHISDDLCEVGVTLQFPSLYMYEKYM